LLKWKAEKGLSDSGFEKLQKMMKNMLPKDNKLPEEGCLPSRFRGLEDTYMP
jgi:hypothetical protein